MPDATTMAKNWQSGVMNGAQKYRDGINNVTDHPGVKAAAQQAKLLQNITNAIQSGRWGRNVSSYNLANWKSTASGVGASNYTNGAQKGLPKYQQFANAIAPRLAQLKQQIAGMPNTTPADADARALAAIHFMRGLKGIGKGGTS